MTRSPRMGPLAAWCLPLLLILAAPPLQGQEDPEDRPRYLAGLVASYHDHDGPAFEQVEDVINRRFTGQDARLKPGPIHAGWHGRIFAAVDGDYRLSVFGRGKMTIHVQGQRVLQGSLREEGWLHGETFSMPFGRHEIQIDFENIAGDEGGAIGLYWEGPKFSREPVGSHFLLHDRTAGIDDSSRRGAELVRGLRCGACHQISGEPKSIPAPDLRSLDGAVHPAWLTNWLTSDGAASDGIEPAIGVRESGVSDVRRMPHFVWKQGDVAAVVAALAPSAPQTSQKAPAAKDLEAGRVLVHSVGCLACHQINGLGSSGVYGGSDLSHIASKRPPGFFETWLKSPEKFNADHRMPVFALSSQERKQAAAYLATLRAASDNPSEQTNAPTAEPALKERGVKLLAARGCVQCHQIRGARGTAPPKKSRLLPTSRWEDSCLQAPKNNRPGYRLSQDDAAAIRTYVGQLVSHDDAPAPEVSGRQLMAESNCTACHQRNGSEGLGAKLNDIVAAHPDWAPRLPAMKPPSLNSVGDKLKATALQETIGRDATRRREWLDVRMPKFRLDDSQLQAIVSHLIQEDRIPGEAPASLSQHPEQQRRVAGRRLVTADGFGCTSCHAVGKVKPSKAPIHAAGPDLAMMGTRIRKSWFDRWVRNPARIVPRMEMPSVQTPVGGVLHQQLDEQLDAVWLVLNTPGFVPPEPNPVRIVRHQNVVDHENAPEYDPRPIVVTDVLHLDDQVLVKPLLIGLANRHNLLYDLEVGRIRGWWTGDTARQHTKGKTWLWRPGAPNLLPSTPAGAELRLFESGQQLSPRKRGQFVTEFEWLAFDGPQIQFAYRLDYASGQPDATAPRESASVWVRETWRPTTNGLQRTLALQGPRAATLRLQPALPLKSVDNQETSLGYCESPTGNKLTIQSASAKWVSSQLQVALNEQGAANIVMEFIPKAPADQFFPRQIEPQPLSPTQLAVAPGFDATRLPLEMEMMPTAMTWRPSGELIVTSLKGQVWQASDTTLDGLEDKAVVFADDLAAPFGAAIPVDDSTARNSVDVVGKYALLRLTDEDEDGRADRWERLASGWGHTADYHDWAVGLPQDKQGGYFLSTACQQDDRSPAAARLRGVVVALKPHHAGQPLGGRRTNPYRLETLTTGHRFPIGIARNRGGELFVTDNQGNYNPFNELNHVKQGRHYGFINKLERKPGFAPPLTDPAVNIPHPWTRSVNGICFLETPSNMRSARGDVFGPYEGHLVGCEYDTRRLIRMSLERVQGEFQGAAYPLTMERVGEEPLLGPLCAAISPRGELYIGCIRDSGWGGSNNIGTVVRLSPHVDQLPPGIAEVKLTEDGFAIHLQSPNRIHWELAADAQRYSVSSYRRISTPAYGGNDVDRREEEVIGLEADPEVSVVRLRLPRLRAGHVYELRIQNLAKDEKEFFPAEAHYTLLRTR